MRSNEEMSQKLLKKPARLLLIAFVAVPAMAVTVNGATPRASVRQVSGQWMADTARLRARQEVYLNEGIERWGLNE